MANVYPSHTSHGSVWDFWDARRPPFQASKLDSFTELGKRPQTADELAARPLSHRRFGADLPTRSSPQVPPAGTSTGPARGNSNGPTARRSSTSRARATWGGFLSMPDSPYRDWGDCREALKTGSPQNEIKHTGEGNVRQAVLRCRRPSSSGTP